MPQAEALVAEAIGRGPAIALSHRLLHSNPFRQGKDCVRGALYVPKAPTPRFIELVGSVEHARALCAAIPGEQLMFSGCRQVLKQLQHHAIRWLYRHGVRISELVRLTGITPKQIRSIVADEPADGNPTDAIAHWKRVLWAYSLMVRAKPLTLD